MATNHSDPIIKSRPTVFKRRIIFSFLLCFYLLLQTIIITPFLFALDVEGLKSVPDPAGMKNDLFEDSQNGPIKLAVIVCTEATIIPTAGSLEFYKGDIPRIIHRAIQNVYIQEKFVIVSNDELGLALKKQGYDLHALEMPGKEDLIRLAADLNAGAILAMELSSLGVMVNRTSYQYHAIARYRAYQARNQRFITRQFLSEGPVFDNKANPKEQKDKLIETIRSTVNIILANCMFGENWE